MPNFQFDLGSASIGKGHYVGRPQAYNVSVLFFKLSGVTLSRKHKLVWLGLVT